MMRFLTAALAAIALALPTLGAPTTLQAIKPYEGQKTGKFIVKLKDGAPKQSFLENVASGMQITHNWDIWHGFAGNFDETTLNALRGSPNVEYIEEDGIMHITTTQGDAPWGLSRLSSSDSLAGSDDSSLNFSYTFDSSAGSGVDVYVVDTGVRITHSQFGGRARWGATFGGYADADGNGHGTHCAGTIAGEQFGVAKAANIVAVKVLSDAGSGSVSDIISGINFVQSQAANSGRPSVISMSLGGSVSKALDDAVTQATKAGIHVIVAAGNEHEDANNSSPARAPGAVAVGASTINDTMASFSNFGSTVAIFAPGQNVISCGITSDTATASLSGTSMATPHVAGLVGYLIGLDGNMSPADMRTKLQSLALKNAVKGVPAGTVNLLAHNA